MTQYAVIGLKSYCVEISNNDFDLLIKARTNLFEALAIEEKLNLVLENYAEFEQELLKFSVNNMMFQSSDWSSEIGKIHVVNRRIINLLTTGRLYVDQVSHNICSIYRAGSEQKEIVEEQTSQEYDSDFPGYRVMEALRNYVQHRELPLHGLSKNMRWIETGSETSLKHTIKLSIDTDTLGEDRKFKKTILTELQSLGKSVEFTPLVRQYLGSIGKVHLKVRELLSSDLLEWEKQIQHFVSQYQKSTGYVAGLEAVVVNESKITERTSIFDDFIKRRQMLENKNRYLTHYSFHFISSEAPEIRTE